MKCLLDTVIQFTLKCILNLNENGKRNRVCHKN